jgi:hypothetical protein
MTLSKVSVRKSYARHYTVTLRPCYGNSELHGYFWPMTAVSCLITPVSLHSITSICRKNKNCCLLTLSAKELLHRAEAAEV